MNRDRGRPNGFHSPEACKLKKTISTDEPSDVDLDHVVTVNVSFLTRKNLFFGRSVL